MSQSDAHMLYHSDLPYPPVQAGKKNPSYARAMLDNLGGSNSEMSAVSLYFYDSLVTAAQEEISLVFHKINVVEMHHMEIFGTLASQLGADPRLWTFRGTKPTYWTPGYHRYPQKLEMLLRYAIEGEEAAVLKYQKQAKMILDGNIVENLNRIILDEQIHIQILKDLYQRYVFET